MSLMAAVVQHRTTTLDLKLKSRLQALLDVLQLPVTESNMLSTDTIY